MGRLMTFTVGYISSGQSRVALEEHLGNLYRKKLKLR